ncbi:MAG: hypothetical protein NVSMB17_11010 [Candidatus Dormibacteria bacterium]
MRIRKVIHKPVKLSQPGVNLVGGLDAVISASIQSGAGNSSVTSHQVTAVTQQGGRSRVQPAKNGDKEVEHD